LNQFDQFVEKICLQGKIVSKKQMQQVLSHQQRNPSLSLLQILVKAKVLDQQQAIQIQTKFETIERDSTQPVSPTEPKKVSASISKGDGSLDKFSSLNDFLVYARKVEASDLFINTDAPPTVRKDNQLTFLERSPFSAVEVEKLVKEGISEFWWKELQQKLNIDTCLSIPDCGRFRTCILKQKDGLNCSFRIIPNEIRTIKELGLPPAVEQLVHYPQGLILVTGPAGSGKTTTMAALVEEINKTRQEHIITIEDPIEYVFEPKQCQISQRSVGDHTRSSSAALRGALREDPDIIMIGELRDHETASLAISASETGHLVIVSLHTNSAAKTISRIQDFFPPDEQPQIRAMISESIRGIISQRLISRKDGDGRVLALEVMINNSAISNIIRKNQLLQIKSTMQISAGAGMILMDSAIRRLYQEGKISGEDCFFNAESNAIYKQFSPEEKEKAKRDIQSREDEKMEKGE
jgi:twitching motility protein PilT